VRWQSQVNNRQYRITLLAQMIDELRSPDARVRRDSGIVVAAYREARECLKQVAIEAGEWQEERPLSQPAFEDLSHLTSEQLFAEQRILRETNERLEAIRAGRPDPLMIEAAAGSVEEVAGDEPDR
jgi:hypothetical protein